MSPEFFRLSLAENSFTQQIYEMLHTHAQHVYVAFHILIWEQTGGQNKMRTTALWSFYSNVELVSFPLLSYLTLLCPCLFYARQILRLEGKMKIDDTDVMEKVTLN